MDQVPFSMLRKRCNHIIKERFKIFKNNVLDYLKLNPKYFWKIFKYLKSNEFFIFHEMTLRNFSITGDHITSSLFWKSFKSIDTNYKQPILSKCRSTAYQYIFPHSNVVVSKDEVLRYVECVTRNFFKKYAEILCKPLVWSTTSQFIIVFSSLVENSTHHSDYHIELFG